MEKNIKNYIIKELLKFKLQRGSKGFKYLVETIYLSIVDVDALDNLSKNVFPIIAKKYNEKSSLNVKWCIDKVIQTMYNNTEMEVISKYFNLEYNMKPSLKCIVYTIVCNYSK